MSTITETLEIKVLLQQVLDRVRQLEDELTQRRAEYDLVYRDVGRLGEALGHVNGAKPFSASSLMAQYIEEVRLLVGLHEPERHVRLEAQKREEDSLR